MTDARKKGYWRTKDGRLLKMQDMETSHIKNTISLLERRLDLIAEVEPPCFQGEMAQMYADQEYSRLMGLENDIGIKLKELKKELQSRVWVP